MAARRQRGTNGRPRLRRGSGQIQNISGQIRNLSPARPGTDGHASPVTIERFEVDAVRMFTASAAGPVGIDLRDQYRQTVYGLAPNPSPIHAMRRTIRFSPSGHVAV
jgi:hypothetical protein